MNKKATYRFRVVRPKPTDWIEVEDTSIEDAIQNYHYKRASRSWADNSVGLMVYRADGTVKEKQWFAVFETADGEEVLSRICVNGIWRRGGLGQKTVADVARELDWDPAAFAGGASWLGEEDYDKGETDE